MLTPPYVAGSVTRTPVTHPNTLTLTVPVTTIDALQHLKQDNDSTVRADGEVGSARYEPHYFPHARA